MRIYIRVEIPETIAEKDLNKKMQKLILNSAQNRALIVIVSYLRHKTIRTQYLPNMKQPIIRAIEKGSLQKMTCNSNYCEDFFHINMREINSIINKTNTLAKKILKSNESKK